MSDTIREVNFNSTRNGANQGNFSFFQTDIEVCQMEYNLIDFSSLGGATVNIGDFECGNGTQINALREHLAINKVTAKTYCCDIDAGRYNETKEAFDNVFSNIEHLDTQRMRIGYHNGKSLFINNFGIIRDNPPYISTDINGINQRLDKYLVDRNFKNLVHGGIHLIELPEGVVRSTNVLRSFLYRYDIPCIAKFPIDVYKTYKQVVLFCKLKKTKGYTPLIQKEYEEKFKKGEIPFLNELADIGEPVIKLEREVCKRACGEINYFREPTISNETLANGMLQCIGKLNESFTDRYRIRSLSRDGIPLMELSPGHTSTLLMAGYYDGILGDLLVRGGSRKKNKKIDSVDDDGKVTEEVIEVFTPFMELTNKEGIAYYKEFTEESENTDKG